MHYLLETYLNVDGQPTILRLETPKDEIKFPDFIDVVRDVSSCDAFFSRNMSSPSYKMQATDKTKCSLHGPEGAKVAKEPYAAERLKERNI
jgi:hypothetical protein